MTGTATSTAAYTFKKALYEAAVDLWKVDRPEMAVIWGSLGTHIPDEYVQFLGTDSNQEPATLGTNRSREETLHLETQWFITRWGEIDASREADEYMYARIGELEEYVRVTNTTLDGVVRHCFLVSHITDARTINQNGEMARLAGAIVRFEAKVRITG